MELVDFLFLQGEGNFMEDAGGVKNNVAWVIDGATAIENQNPSLTSEVINKLNELLHTFNNITNLDVLLRTSLKQIYSDFSHIGEELDKVSFTIAIVKYENKKLEFIVFGDSYIVLKNNKRVKVYTDDAFARNSLDNKLLLTKNYGNLKLYTKNRRKNKNKKGGYYIGTLNGDFLNKFNLTTIDIHDGTELILCSDGFARICNLYSKYSWKKLFSFDLLDVGKKIRSIEDNDVDRVKFPRFKGRDDIIAIKVKI